MTPLPQSGYVTDMVALVGRTIGQRILAAMQYAGLNKTQLAERVGVSWPTVNSWTKDEYAPNATNLKRISDCTGIAMRWIQTGTGDPIDSDESPPAYHEFVAAFGHLFPPEIVEGLKGDPFGRFGGTPDAKAYLELATLAERVRAATD